MTNKKTKAFILSLIAIVILGAIGLMYAYKNKSSVENDTSTSPSTSTSNNPGSDTSQDSIESDSFFYIKGDIDLDTLKESGVPVIIAFGSKTCGPCRTLKPILFNLKKRLDGKAIIKYVSLDENIQAAYDYDIQVIPTMLLFDKDGNAFAASNEDLKNKYGIRTDGDYSKLIGAVPEQLLMELLEDMGLENE